MNDALATVLRGCVLAIEGVKSLLNSGTLINNLINAQIQLERTIALLEAIRED